MLRDDNETDWPVKPFGPTAGRVKSDAVPLCALVDPITDNRDNTSKTAVTHLDFVFLKVTA